MQTRVAATMILIFLTNTMIAIVHFRDLANTLFGSIAPSAARLDGVPASVQT